MEEDGRGAPAEPDRQAILEQDGEWCLIVENSSGTPAMIALKVLREELNLSLTETGNLRKLLPGPILAGTRIEMERLVRVLKKKGINSSTKQITTDVVKQ